VETRRVEREQAGDGLGEQTSVAVLADGECLFSLPNSCLVTEEEKLGKTKRESLAGLAYTSCSTFRRLPSS